MADNEVSLNIEETNKLRISLGLKPLRLDSEPSQADKERKNHEAKKAVEAETQAQELRKKLDAAREKRLTEAKLRAVKTLGAADDDEGDMASWVERNRKAEVQRKEAAAQKAAEAAAGGGGKGAGGGKGRGGAKRRKRDDSDDEGGYKADELAGLKVRHDLGEVGEGETVIVTLADKSLLDERGDLRDEDDELENTLLAEERKRRKARKASVKEAKPLWEEDGKVRTLLEKYDEEEEDMVTQLGVGGGLEADRMKRQEEVRKKLAAGNAKLADYTAGAGPSGASAATGTGDYYTPAEMAAFGKPKKKKDKKERRIRAKSAEAEEGADILAALEAQAEEAAAAATSIATAGGAAGDLGRRADRGAAQARAEEARLAVAEDKKARFEKAVQKANWASQFLRPTKGTAGGAGAAGAAAAAAGPVVGDDDEDADRELRESLERARRLAAKKKEEDEAKRRAEEEEAEAAKEEAEASAMEGVEGAEPRKPKVAAKPAKTGIAALFSDVGVIKQEEGAPSSEMLTATMEFVRNITAAPSAATTAKAGGTASAMPGGAAAAADGTATAGGAASVRGGPGAYAEGDGSDLDDDGDARMGDGGGDEAGGRTGTWVTAEEGEGAEGTGRGKRGGAAREGSEGPGGAAGGAREPTPEVDGGGLTAERSVGRGLAGALGLLNDKGALKEQVEWSGRNNDKSKNAVLGLDDVYSGGRHQDRVARSVEAALTIRDKLGRVLTPKERFRQLCYSFHGIQPSKNQVDKAAARDAKELAIKKAATTEDPSAELDRLRAVQRASGSAYVVLSGKNAGLPMPAAGNRLGGSDDEDDGAARRRAPRPAKGGMPPPGGPAHPMSGVRGGAVGNLTPLLGDHRKGGGPVGNLTPLLGDRKVEAMFGIKKPPKPPGSKR